MEKPIQKATPKNWLGVSLVRALVAKKMPITGRVVAIPKRIPMARVSQRSWREWVERAISELRLMMRQPAREKA